MKCKNKLIKGNGFCFCGYFIQQSYLEVKLLNIEAEDAHVERKCLFLNIYNCVNASF